MNNHEQHSRDIHDAPTVDVHDAANQGIDLHAEDALPDIPDAGDDSQPITSPDPIDFSTKGITAAGAAGMSTFNDGGNESLFERTVDAFEASGIHSPMIGDEPPQAVEPDEHGGGSRVRIYPGRR